MKYLIRTSLLLLVISLSACTVNYSLDVSTSRTQVEGFSVARMQRISEMNERYIRDRKYTGIVTLVTRNGKVVHSDAKGTYGLNNDTPMSADTLFRIFSMTKPVTAVAAMQLYEQGKFQLNDPVSQYLPEFRDQKILRDGQLVAPQSPMTIRQLFTHTAGLTYGSTPDNPVDLMYGEAKLFETRNLTEFSAELAKLPLRFEPGTRYHYSVATDLLGALVERLSGQPLDQYFAEHIFVPLGMTDTFFSVPADKRHRLAGSHIWDAESGSVQAVPEDRQRNYTDVTLFSGGGGLVSTISDYARFCEIFINGGLVNNVQVLGPKTVQFMSSNHLRASVRAEGVGQYPSADFYPGQSMALGMGVITNAGITPAISSKGELSWGGTAGTKFWIDPAEGVIGIAMVQLYRAPWPLRFDLKVATYQALLESNTAPSLDYEIDY
jgi:CubicO group peptidase (beta-lactamase class C family)